MTYNDFINEIISSRGRSGCIGYCESHHIIPRCLGGLNDTENLVDLYAQEHYDAHKLLALENPENDGLWNAWAMMAFPKGDTHRDDVVISNEDYALLKKSNSRLMSKKMKGRSPINKGLHYYNNGTITITANKCLKGFTEGFIVSESGKKRLGHAKGKHYYNNGIVEVREFECPEGFEKGRLPGTMKTMWDAQKKVKRQWFNDGINEYWTDKCPKNCVKGRLFVSQSTKGYHWFNNGSIEITSKTCPDGYVKGKLKNK